MATSDNGRPLPKFGEWDANDPASAEGFSLIFSKVRDEKKGNETGGSGSMPAQENIDVSRSEGVYQQVAHKKWFCCF